MALTMTPTPIFSSWTVVSATLTTPGPVCDLTEGPVTLGCILELLFRQVGLTPADWDLTAATDVVDGFLMGRRGSVAGHIQDLLRIYSTDLVEVDGKIKAVKRGGAVAATVTEDDLGAHHWQGEQAVEKIEARRVQELELPQRIDLTYFSEAKDFEQAHQAAVRGTKTDVAEAVTVNTPVVMTEDVARQAAEKILYTQWLEREQFRFRLGPKFLKYHPGDVLNVPVAGQTTRVRVVKVDAELFGVLEFNAVLDEATVLTQSVPGSAGFDRGDQPSPITTTTLKKFSPNALRDIDADTVGFYAAANGASAGDWPGAVLFLSRDGGTTFEAVADLPDLGEFGTADTELLAPTGLLTGLFDEVNTVDVTMTQGVPVSAAEIEVLNGANAALLGAEVIQFRTVTALGGAAYRLSGLLRGRRGTEGEVGTHAINDEFVLLDPGGAVVRVELDQSLINKVVTLKAVTNGESLASTSSTTLTITGNELKPYRGTDAQGARDGSNNLTITWIRRTRKGGAWADLKDADLVDTPESYEVDVLDSPGGTVLRTIAVSTPSAAYTAAEQTTDGLTPGDPVDVVIYQLGPVGRGYGLVAVV